jgi:hypothetical protein
MDVNVTTMLYVKESCVVGYSGEYVDYGLDHALRSIRIAKTGVYCIMLGGALAAVNGSVHAVVQGASHALDNAISSFSLTKGDLVQFVMSLDNIDRLVLAYSSLVVMYRSP